MGCFVIKKEDYIKAAGIIAGIANTSSNAINKFWLFNYEEGRNYNTEDYHKAFSRFFEYNAISVQERYRDKQPKTDTNEYRETFTLYMKKGAHIYFNKRTQETKDAIMHLRNFFSSCVAQTDNSTYAAEMENFFNKILVNLMGYAINTNIDSMASWGAFEL